MKLPKVGENFYWEGIDGEVHEDICMKIEQKDNPDVETMYFTYISSNGGGTFITEDCLISSLSDKVKKFKKEQAEKKIKEISDYISQKEVQDYLYNKLCDSFPIKDAKKILNILSNYE